MRDNPKVPQNLQAERAVLGGVILDSSILGSVIAVLEERDFLLSENQCIFRHICKMNAEGSPIDLLTLFDRLENLDELDRAGGACYISSLIDGLHKKSNGLVPIFETTS
jgi:replicative DNA helicase